MSVEVARGWRQEAVGSPSALEDRFADHLAGLGSGSPSALTASCADRLEGLRDLLEAEAKGERLLARLAPRPGALARHLAALRALYAPAVAPDLLAAYDEACQVFAAHLTRWLPGRAVAIAAEAHQGQFDKAGQPYVLHPMRLMLRAATPAEQMAAVLHDVVEDTAWTLAALADEGFPPEVLRAVDCLTKREGEGYDAFLDRVLTDPVATRVKLLDLEDNLDTRRITALDEKDLERLRKYHRARQRLLVALGGGG